MSSKNTDKLIYLAMIMGVLIVALGIVALFPEYGIHVLLSFAALLFVWGAGLYLQFKDANNWIESLATIVSIEERTEKVAEQKYSTTTYYYPVIKYEYVCDNVNYRSDRVSFEKSNYWKTKEDVWGHEPPATKWWWRELEPGDQCDVYIDPEDNSNSVLVKELSKKRRSHYLALMVSGVLLGLVCIFLLRSNLVFR